MGLSIEERYSKLCFTVSGLYGLPRLTGGGIYIEKQDRINQLLDKVWVHLLGKTSNGMHWIVGSDSDADHFPGPSLLGSAFGNVLYKHRAKEKRSNRHVVYLDRDDDKWWSWIPGSVKLIERAYGPDAATIWRAQKLIENAFYPINRYDDDFSESFPGLKETLCELQGILFDIFSDDEIFFKAWMLKSIIGRILPIGTDEDDIVIRVFREFHCHHNIDMREVSFEWVERLFRRHQRKRGAQWSTSSRMGALIRLMGSHFHHDHQHDKLVDMINEHNEKHSSKKKEKHWISSRVNNLLVDCQEKKARKSKREESHTSYCSLTNEEVKF